MKIKDLYTLPDNLPVPADDGACDHLAGIHIPSIFLDTSSDTRIDPSAIAGWLLIFFYPMIGKPGSPPLTGWNDIPGARGCTPQACSFRDNYATFEERGIRVLGVSSQALSDQKEAAIRLGLPFELINDARLELARAMRLPTFAYQSSTFIKRITIIAEDGVVRKVFYPVFPPDKHIDEVIMWIQQNIEPCR